jgi:hypothetical protein
VRYESAIFFWHDDAHEVDIVSGPAMSMSPAATLAQPRSRIPGWDFSPYPSPSPVMQRTVAGQKAIYFDGTPPPQFAWTLVGKNPPELKIDPDTPFPHGGAEGAREDCRDRRPRTDGRLHAIPADSRATPRNASVPTFLN